jgi:hypothetical protein
MLANLRPTLRRVFVQPAGLALSLALLFYLVLDGSKRTILQSAERSRDSISREVVLRVTDYLNEAPLAVAHFEKLVVTVSSIQKRPTRYRTGLLSLLLANGHISEASFTFAESTGFDSDEKHSAQSVVRRAGHSLSARRTISLSCACTRFDGNPIRRRSGKAFKGRSARPETSRRTDPASHRTRHSAGPGARGPLGAPASGRICIGRNWTRRCRKSDAARGGERAESDRQIPRAIRRRPAHRLVQGKSIRPPVAHRCGKRAGPAPHFSLRQ